MGHYKFRRIALIALLYWTASPAFAESVPRQTGDIGCRMNNPQPAAHAAGSSAPIVPGIDWSLGKFVASGGRPRIVQICVVVMCIALFILMRKLH